MFESSFCILERRIHFPNLHNKTNCLHNGVILAMKQNHLPPYSAILLVPLAHTKTQENNNNNEERRIRQEISIDKDDFVVY